MHYLDKQDAVGTVIGSALGMIKYFIVGVLTWSLIWETIIVSGIGATIGFIATQIWKYVVTTRSWKSLTKSIKKLLP